MREIVLEEKFDEHGKYLGKITCYEEDLTPELMEKTKKDPLWIKYRKILKDKGYNTHEVEPIE